MSSKQRLENILHALRSYVEGGLLLLPSHSDPKVMRWQRSAPPIPEDMQPHAERLRGKFAKALHSMGSTAEERATHLRQTRRTQYIGSEDMVNVEPHHMAEALERASGYASGLIDHLYAGDHAHTPEGRKALEFLSHINIRHVPASATSNITDYAHYTMNGNGYADTSTLLLGPEMLGTTIGESPNQGVRHGVITPEGILTHEVAHALDNALSVVHQGGDHEGFTLEQRMERVAQGRFMGSDIHSPQYVAPLHDAILSRGRKKPSGAGFAPVSIPELPHQVARLHYGGSSYLPDWHTAHIQHPDSIGRHSMEYISVLSEMAAAHPEALHAIHQSFPTETHPADLVRQHWGFDFPDADRARRNTRESQKIHRAIEKRLTTGDTETHYGMTPAADSIFKFYPHLKP